MPRKPATTLTEAELRIMRVLWSTSEASVSELVSAVSAVTPLAYTTVLTTVRILEDKGFVRHVQRGRAFIYSARVQEQEAVQTELRRMLGRFFGGSRERLLLSLLKDDDLSQVELDEVKRAIAQSERDSSAGGGR